jgi:hypothetical protein
VRALRIARNCVLAAAALVGLALLVPSAVAPRASSPRPAPVPAGQPPRVIADHHLGQKEQAREERALEQQQRMRALELEGARRRLLMLTAGAENRFQQSPRPRDDWPPGLGPGGPQTWFDPEGPWRHPTQPEERP